MTNQFPRPPYTQPPARWVPAKAPGQQYPSFLFDAERGIIQVQKRGEKMTFDLAQLAADWRDRWGPGEPPANNQITERSNL